MRITIKPKEVITKTIISAIEVGNGEISLNKSVRFPVKTLDENGSVVNFEFIEISGDDYKKWGSDDNYIVSIVTDRLEIEKLYDEKLISKVKELISGQGDGRISKPNAEMLLEVGKAEGVTDIEKETIYFIRKEFNWTDAAERWFDENY